LAPNQVLNPDGDARGDGRPDIVWRDSSWPLVAWAYDTGSHFDIAFAEWDGAQWTDTAFVTATPEDEGDPCLFVGIDGTVHVVWWTAGTSERVYLATREAGSSTWVQPVLVTAGSEPGRRPSVTVFSGEVYVAYERDWSSPGMAQDVLVATLQAGRGFVTKVIAETTRAAALDIVLHAEQGHLWADWKHEVGEFGCAEHQPGSGWTGNAPQPWFDPSWIGVEEARRAVRSQIVE
jgi:hypothetical protein